MAFRPLFNAMAAYYYDPEIATAIASTHPDVVFVKRIKDLVLWNARNHRRLARLEISFYERPFHGLTAKMFQGLAQIARQWAQDNGLLEEVLVHWKETHAGAPEVPFVEFARYFAIESEDVIDRIRILLRSATRVVFEFRW